MISTRRGFLRGLVATVAVASLTTSGRRTPVTLAAPIEPASASTAPVVHVAQTEDWVSLGPDSAVHRLFAPASGPLFATVPFGLVRSDDAGATWRQVNLPAMRGSTTVVEVDPTDHRILFVDTEAGLQRSDDEGATWAVILPSDRQILRMAISPADPRTLYVANASAMGGSFGLLRSDDRGTTWQTLDEQLQGPCSWGAGILTPHPTDTSRIFRRLGCYAGRNVGDDLEESRDGGATWRNVFTPKTAFPHAIAGGAGLEPDRFYLSVNNDARSGGSLLFASSDNGASWVPILENKGGGTMAGAREPNVTIGGLAYNPTVPANVYVGMNSKADPYKPIDFGTVSATNDGGATWTPFGAQPLKQVNDLALGIDGRYLFAATGGGVQRLMLG